MGVGLEQAPKLATLVQTLRAGLREDESERVAAYLKTEHPAELLAARSHSVDQALQQLWRAVGAPTELALVAVGGYGRGELYPSSDVDLLVLTPSSRTSRATTAAVERLVSLCWDIGLHIGHSVRGVAQCLKQGKADISVQTALLETRLLAGDAPRFADFQRRILGSIKVKNFYTAKRLEQEARYRRFNDSAFNLEPNCKEAPGGLRDLQVVLWVARAAQIGSHWGDLEKAGLLSSGDFRSLCSAEKKLQNLRVGLHLETGRCEDRLLFDYQTAIAARFGFVDTSTRRASEKLMQAYYRNAKLVMQLNELLLQNLGERVLPRPPKKRLELNTHFHAQGFLLDVADENVFDAHPPAIFECFNLLQTQPELHGLSARTLRALWRARRLVDSGFRADPGNRKAFLSLLQSETRVVQVFRMLNQYDILGRYLPAFGRIVGQMQHDLFHIYTVDQHILMVLRNLRRFARPEYAHEYPECTRLITAFERPWLLYIAALFHDIAKGRGGDHSKLGQTDALDFCKKHAVSKDDSELVAWLVREHLLMSAVAQKSDISDQRVIADFAAQVCHARRLTALYLLSVADIRGTSPKVWNNWKARLLAELYRRTHAYLEGEESERNKTPSGIIEERQTQALRQLRLHALPTAVCTGWWQQFEPAYFLRHSSDELAWHARTLYYHQHESLVVSARPQGETDLEVLVYAEDEPELIVRLAAFFVRAGYSVADAKIHTTAAGRALDSFVLLDQSQAGRKSREQTVWMEHTLLEALQEPVTPPTRPRHSRLARHFPLQPELSITAEDNGQYYVLYLSAVDYTGLLYTVADLFGRYRINLHTARIATLGERVEDVFLVSGEALVNPKQRVRFEAALLEALSV